MVFLKQGWIVGLCLGLLVMQPAMAVAADPAVEALLQEVRALKAQVNALQNKVQELEAARAPQLEKRVEAAERQALAAHDKASQASTNLSKLSQELAKPAKPGTGLLSELEKRVSITGAVELEGAFERRKPKNGSETSSSDFALATAEVIIEAKINKYAKGVIHFLWEDGDDAVGLDEGFIVVGQTEDMPFYAMGGVIYPAVGLFDTYLVSDPITLNVFETQETALEVGWAGGMINIGAGAFNSDVKEASDDPDNLINTFYGRVQFELPEDAIGGVALSAGVAYTNNIAASDFLRDEVADQRLTSLVGGWSASLKLEIASMIGLVGEYVGALEDFEPGELGFAGDAKARPAAYNVELAYLGVPDWTFAVRYEGSQDLFNAEPEKQWGLGVSWEFLEDTTLSLEYLRGEYENGDERDLVTTQLAVSF